MIKNVIKEIGIAIMLLIAIALILSIIFYQYIPNNKTVPIAVKPYSMPEDIQEELKESINDKQENIVKTLYISNNDLDVYESKKVYNKGKANPFADYSVNENNVTQTENNKASNNQSNTNTSESKNNTAGSAGQNKAENITRNEVYVSTPGKN